MGSKFIEKHKRKSLLALLLFFVKGRGKYAAILLVVCLASAPFLVSSETLNRFIQFPAVSAALRLAGLGSVVSSLEGKYSSEYLKAMIDRDVIESEQNSYWNRMMRAVESSLPCGSGCNSRGSSISMVKGGKDLLADIGRRGKARNSGGGPIKGVVSAEDKERGGGADEVDLQGLLGGMGNAFGGNLGGQDGMAAPYVSKEVMGMRGSAASGGGMLPAALDQANNRVPVPGTPQATRRSMGRVSGFSWRNVGYRSRSVTMAGRIGSRRPMFQLAETFGTTGSAARDRNTAYEYQAAYTGSTYDGNDINAEVIETAANVSPVGVPDTAFTQNLIDTAGGYQGAAQECSEEMAEQNPIMAGASEKIEEIMNTLGSPPRCCRHGAVRRWNRKIDRIKAQCRIYNDAVAAVNAKCGEAGTVGEQNCSSYNRYYADTCSRENCIIALILVIAAIIATGFIGVYVVAALFGIISFDFNNFGVKLETLVSWVASGGDSSQSGEDRPSMSTSNDSDNT